MREGRSLACLVARAEADFTTTHVNIDEGHELGEMIVDVARLGQFHEALRLVQFRPSFLPVWIQAEQDVLEELPEWQRLAEAVELTVRIDSLLAQIEGECDTGRILALECRSDLGEMPVLADWLEDDQRLAWADETRHLFELTRGFH